RSLPRRQLRKDTHETPSGRHRSLPRRQLRKTSTSTRSTMSSSLPRRQLRERIAASATSPAGWLPCRQFGNNELAERPPLSIFSCVNGSTSSRAPVDQMLASCRRARLRSRRRALHAFFRSARHENTTYSAGVLSRVRLCEISRPPI